MRGIADRTGIRNGLSPFESQTSGGFMTAHVSLKSNRKGVSVMTFTRFSRLSTFVTLVLAIAAGVVQAQTFSVLYNFGSNSGDPYKPAYSGIIAQGRDGNLYSTAPGGGTCCGALFQITPAGKLKNIHNFTGNNNDGAFPQGGVTLGSDGNFYGTTYEGGSVTAGAVFKITPSGTATTLYSFTGGSDGAA